MIDQYDVLVIGGGPGGLAAAFTAAQGSRRVALVDDNAELGGQIWRGGGGDAPKLSRGYEHLLQTTIIDAPARGVLTAVTPQGSKQLGYKTLILATGARELFIPFPGWTLPNVTGAGGLQAMVKSGLNIHDKRIIVAGSGPLLLAVAAYLRSHGADIRLIAEQTSPESLRKFMLSLAKHPSKVLQGLALRSELVGVRYAAGLWPVRAEGTNRLQGVTLSDGTSIECDYLACGFGLVPNLELPRILGCEIHDGFVKVDRWQRTSIPGVLAVGEITGIGGQDLAISEGEIAGNIAGGHEGRARSRMADQANAKSFAEAVNKAFALRKELLELADHETIVCRCEDVGFGSLKHFRDWRDAKLHTRCGMGPCQGRICGAALQFLKGWDPEQTRPPIHPVPLSVLAQSEPGRAKI